MRQLKKYGLYMLLAAILLLTAACGRNNTNKGTTADDNMAGTLSHIHISEHTRIRRIS